MSEAGAKAGYAHRQDSHKALKSIRAKAPEILERLGMTVEHVADKCLRPLLTAEETKFFADKGVVIDSRTVAAYDIRARAIDLWAKLMGAYTPQKLQVNGSLTLEMEHLSDDELDQTIADLAGPAEPAAQA